MRPSLLRMRHAQRHSDDPPRVRGSINYDADSAGNLHALRQPDLCGGLPSGRDQENFRRRRAIRKEGALYRVQQLWTRLPFWCAEGRGHGHRIDDEVRHVLRPHIRGAQTHVCVGLPQPMFILWYSAGARELAALIETA